MKPLSLEREGLAQQALDLLQPDQRQPDLKQWQTLVERSVPPATPGRDCGLGNIHSCDAYLSVVEALRHAVAAGWRPLLALDQR